MSSSSPVKGREWEKSLTVKCRLCGGAKCKRCSESAALAKTDSPIRGLHADWVADRMLGMMRPSSRLMKEYEIAAQFHKLGIAAVFNLTLPGEHPYCGDGLGPSGFPYNPETDLMAEKIRFYNFGWEDMTTPTLPFMLNIVKVMDSVLQGGHNKLAVHCHAGYGRTGLAIACCLLFMHNILPDRAIKIVRRDRPGSIQTKAQAKFVRLFHEYLNASKIVFALPLIHDRFTIAEIAEQQNRLVHGEKYHGARHVLPRALDFLCREVEKVAEHNATAVVHGFVFHLQWQGHDRRRALCDLAEQYAKHGKAVFGEAYGSDTEAALPATGGIVPPPPVPASLASSAYCVTQEALFPVKVAFNAGEWNWTEAMALDVLIPTHAPALLLDWLEHLAAPLLDAELVALVAASAEENAIVKWKPLNQQPSCTFRALDRMLTCLRHLLRKAETLPSGGSLHDALYVRTAMALFHLTTATPVATLCKHADFIKQLVHEWQPPKRLELNFESLQKFTTTSSRKILLHSPTKFSTDPELACPSTPPSVSPTRSAPDLVSLEPVAHPRPQFEIIAPGSPKTTSPLKLSHDTFPSTSPVKLSHEPLPSSSPVKLPHDTPPPSSPVQPRPPPVELPPMTRDKEERAAEPSPVKMESLVPRFLHSEPKKDVEASASSSPTGTHHHHHHVQVERDAQPLIPTPPAAAGSPERAALHPSASSPSYHTSATTPPPLARGPGSSGNVYSLPSVKVTERYRNRQG